MTSIVYNILEDRLVLDREYESVVRVRLMKCVDLMACSALPECRDCYNLAKINARTLFVYEKALKAVKSHPDCPVVLRQFPSLIFPSVRGCGWNLTIASSWACTLVGYPNVLRLFVMNIIIEAVIASGVSPNIVHRELIISEEYLWAIWIG